MFRRVISITSVAFVGTAAAIIARYLYVQNEIENAPLETTEYSKSGYTPPGIYGHGNLTSEDGSFGWYIYDISDPRNIVRKACVKGILPQPEWDVDFIYSNGRWYKLRSGLGILSPDGFVADPPTEKWKGALSTQLTFPVRKPKTDKSNVCRYARALARDLRPKARHDFDNCDGEAMSSDTDCHPNGRDGHIITAGSVRQAHPRKDEQDKR